MAARMPVPAFAPLLQRPLRELALDQGLTESAGWTASLGLYFISGGSHAGRVGRERSGVRWTPSTAIRLVPIEKLASSAASFAVSPPWAKAVYRDPEDRGTD